MLVYFLVILITYLTALMIKFKNLTKKWTFLDIFILLILIIFSGIRFNVGTDYEIYYFIYNNIVSSNFSLDDYNATTQEFGYYVLSWITKRISDSPYGIFWASAFLTYIPIYVRIKKDSKDFAFSILLFFLLGLYTGPFNTIRQWIAIAINFYSLQYINTDKKKFLLFNIIGSLFHSTCIIAMIIQLIAKKVKPTFTMLIGILIFGIVFVMLFGRMSFLFEILSNINPRYTVYFEPQPGGTGSILLFVLRVIIVLYLLFFTKYNEYQYEKTLLMISLFFMMLGFYNVFVQRMEAYFGIVLVLLLPNILCRMKSIERWMYKYYFTIVFLVVFIFSLIFYANLIPYKTYIM
ncbi:EpsG family protein [Parageobacillus thermoglucosidasius]|uniref:EpsG family protein n=1 Tax=Parageobacillus thermoglucosidasius TaxID=1426 RepID=UPI001FCC411E|nr:EpsG family protein [Parageobacillus thermoglucosidasius]BDG30601.1 hypothetical protein PthBH41_03130 [Parageobacillus thermoglucosidasius]